MPRQARLQRPPLPPGEPRRPGGLDPKIAGQVCGPTRERVLPAEQLVTNAGQRIQIVAGIGGAAFQQLATCISWSCSQGAETQNANFAIPCYQDVPWI